MRGIEQIINDLPSRTIADIIMTDSDLTIFFTDGSKLIAEDWGQQCCEWRYMTTDDDLAYFVGTDLTDIKISAGGYGYGEHGDVDEIEFLIVSTSLGDFTIENHNEHNGYYGGFDIELNFMIYQMDNVFKSFKFTTAFENGLDRRWQPVREYH